MKWNERHWPLRRWLTWTSFRDLGAACWSAVGLGVEFSFDKFNPPRISNGETKGFLSSFVGKNGQTQVLFVKCSNRPCRTSIAFLLVDYPGYGRNAGLYIGEIGHLVRCQCAEVGVTGFVLVLCRCVQLDRIWHDVNQAVWEVLCRQNPRQP